MDREEIIRMARGACDQAPREDWNSTAWVFGDETLERFAALVAKHEREACAKVCEEVESRAEELWDKFAYPEDQGMASGARQCAAAIRARSKK
jgi:hypothetical protein